MEYDYLVVGSGLYGSVFARQKAEQGARVLIIEKRNHIAGNAFTEKINGIDVHRYGAHIFHTSNREVWDYVNRFAEFNRFTNSPVARWHDEVYSLPFSMYTFNKLWGVTKPEHAKEIIEEQRRAAGVEEPRNLEEQAIFLVGTDVYEKLIKGYTEKQWGRSCRELPAFIIRRLPVRYTYDNNYFNDIYQGIPTEGYTAMVANILDHGNISLQLGEDYLLNRDKWRQKAGTVVWTGQLDAWFDYRLGNLEYRSLRFETEVLNTSNYQGNAVVNYTDKETPWLRIIEHKWFRFPRDEENDEFAGTVITREFSTEWSPGEEPYYPINDERNKKLCEAYQELAKQEKNVIFGGRLGEYRYYDMDQVILAALNAARESE